MSRWLGREVTTMRKLIAGLLLLTLCSSAAAEGMHGQYIVNPEGERYVHTRRDCPAVSAWYQGGMNALTAVEAAALGDRYQPCAVCGEGDTLTARETQPAEEPDGSAYVVGVDLPQGLYSFFSSDDTPGVMTVTNWDGSIAYQQEVYSGWYETMVIYNEQTVYLPANCQGEFHKGLFASDYDTGTRQLRLTQPGVFRAGADMLPGLYIVQNDGAKDAAVKMTDDTGKVLHAWLLPSGAQYTILMKNGYAVEFSDGCLLRSMAPERLLREGTSASVVQGRYIVGMQLPERDYTFTGREGESLVRVTSMVSSAEDTHTLLPGESWTLAISGWDTRELLVEMVNVDVSWEPGES